MYSAEKTGFSWADKLDLYNELPKNLRYEVSCIMHKGAARKLAFFRGKDKAFVSFVIPLLLP
jgi:hypothetical protein